MLFIRLAMGGDAVSLARENSIYSANSQPRPSTRVLHSSGDNLCGHPDSHWLGQAWECTQEVLRWRMQTSERTLSGHFVSPTTGLVSARDIWR